MWISDKEKELLKELDRQFIDHVLYGKPMSYHIEHSPKKWAWIDVGEDRIMAWVDNETMIAYESDGYEQTDIVIPEYTFVRWCRLMDL